MTATTATQSSNTVPQLESDHAAIVAQTMPHDTATALSLEHIDPRLWAVANGPLAARIRQVLVDLMIVHPHLVGLLNEVEWLIREPKRQRARGDVFCGDPGSGKTSIAGHVKKKYPIDNPQAVTSNKCPRVVSISMSGARSTKDVFKRILIATGAPISRRYSTSDHELIVVETLRRMQCGLLILDEAQDILQIAEREQLRVLETIKYLMNTVNLPVLALGTDPARMAFRADPHLQARFEIHDMPRWTPGEDFGAFLDALERCLPLRFPSNLSDIAIQNALIKKTDGIMDKVMNRIRAAAIEAMIDGSEHVTAQALLKGSARPSIDVLGPH